MAASDSVVDLLARHGPALSSEIRQSLQNDVGVSEDAARKRVSRASDPVRRLDGIRFPHNESFLYLPDQFNSDRFWSSLLRAFDETRSAYGLAIHSLKARGGRVPIELFPTISGSPDRLVGHSSYSRVLETLTTCGLLVQYQEQDLQQYVSFHPKGPILAETRELTDARRLVEAALLDAIRDWLRNLGLVSYESVKVRDLSLASKAPKVGQFFWDLTGPSYASPFVTTKKDEKPVPGFVVADVVLGKELTAQEVEYFVHKSLIHRSQRSQRPLMSILVADFFAKDALRRGKSQGVMLCTPAGLFGDDVASALRQLIGTLENAGAVAAGDPKKLDELFSRLTKVEGLAGSLRGPFFEMIVAHLVKEVQGTSIDIRKRVVDPQSGGHAEIDVLRVKSNQEAWFYECKGKEPGGVVDVGEVRDWYTRQVPRMRAWALAEERFRKARLGFEFWTTGRFSDSALEYLRSLKAKHYELMWRDGVAVRSYAREGNQDPIVVFLDNHYLDEGQG